MAVSLMEDRMWDSYLMTVQCPKNFLWKMKMGLGLEFVVLADFYNLSRGKGGQHRINV